VQRTFLANLALVLVLNLLVKPFYILGIDAGVQVRVGSEAYGGYAALLSLSFLLNILLDLGITNYNARNIARHEQLLQKHLSGILSVRIVLVALYAVITFLVAGVLGYRGEQLGLLAILVLNQALAATVLYLRSNLAGAQLFAQDSLLSVLDRALLIVMVGWMLWVRADGAPLTITWFAWAQTIAYGAAVLVALVLVLRRSGALRVSWKAPFARMILRQSFPYALLILLMTFYYRTDTVMLERLLPDGALQAGIYAQGFRFFEAFNMLGYLMAGLLLPMFSRMIKRGDDVAGLTGLAIRLMLAASLAVAVMGSVFATDIMQLRYAEHTDRSAPAFAVLIWCFVAVSTTYVFGTLLTAAGDLKALNWMAAAGMLLNIGLNLALIPRWQALGAAWSSLITQGLTALVQVLIAHGRFRLRPSIASSGRAALYLLGLLGMAHFASSLEQPRTAVMVVLVVAMMLWALGSGMVPLKSLRAMIKASG